jgi:2-keto-myo-inositol isomerase
VEPLGFEICSLRSKKEAVEAINSVHHADQFKIVHDTVHHFLAGETDLFPEQTGIVHISGVTDANIGTSAMLDAHRVLVDDADRLGNLAQIATLLNSGYKGPLSFEPFAAIVQNDPHLRSSIEASMHFINRHLAAE